MKLIALTLLSSLALGCGSTDDAVGEYEWHALPESRCNARIRSAALQSVEHVAAGTEITWSTNPPSSGRHEAFWARWGFATSVIPRNNWVHNLEHGGVVFLYRCADATCAEAVALRQVVPLLPNDPSCALSDGTQRPRVLVTPDPLIARPVSAVAWGRLYEADCVEPEALREFYNAHVARGPENTCAEGFVP